jgi:exonuclease 3'-5' domain-containing protein 1
MLSPEGNLLRPVIKYALEAGRRASLLIASSKVKMLVLIQTEIIDTVDQVRKLSDWLDYRLGRPPPWDSTMYMGLEGVNLCRKGSISILTILVDSGVAETGIATRYVYLVDVHKLGKAAFNTAGRKRTTLKDILEDEDTPKVVFDVRNDSDALFAHFGVSLQGVEDVQLMDSATRATTVSRRTLNSLAKCIERNTRIDSKEHASWKLAKERGERLFMARHGGTSEIFNQRPIPEEIISYCAGDIRYLPELREKLWKSRAEEWQDFVKQESQNRVKASQKPDYLPQGPDKMSAPWSEDQNKLLDEWNYKPPSDSFDESVKPVDDSYDDDWYDDENDSED